MQKYFVYFYGFDTIEKNISFYNIFFMAEYEIQNARFFSSDSGMHFAPLVVKELGVSLSPLTISKFSCGELYVRYDESIRGRHVFLFHTIRPGSVNDDFMELFLLCNAARQSFAKSVHVVLPHLGYARQDKIHDARETISAKLMADLMVQSGANHVITLHLHSDQTQGFFDVPVDNINTQKIFIEYFSKKIQQSSQEFLVVSPDAGGAKYAKKFADQLGVNLAIMHKSRPAHNQSEVHEVVGNIEGKTCILVDDIVDTAGSVVAAKKALIQHGANPEVYLCATHPVFSGSAEARLKESQFKEIVISDSLPLKSDLPEITVISSAPLLANIISNVLQQRSVSGLF